MKIYQLAIYTILLSLLLLSCTNNATDSDHDHDEPPAGVQLLSNQNQLAVQNGVEITYPSGTSIPLQVDETILVEVQFLNDDGDVIVYHADEGYSLEVLNKSSDILQISSPEVVFNEEDEWLFQIRGLTLGSASFAVELKHAGHSDFLSRDFSVTVSE